VNAISLKLDRDDQWLGERLAIGGTRVDPVLSGNPDARDFVVTET
jgi:hypothetical protein